MTGNWAIAAALLLLGQAGAARPTKAPVVTVRVIDARNGAPYPSLPVFVTLNRWKLEPGDPRFGSAEDTQANFKKTTDAKGEISFRLPDPVPPQIVAEAGGPQACGNTLFDTKKVLGSGVAGDNGCKGKLRKMRIKFEARPGEIVVFARPFSFWDGFFDSVF